MFSDIITHFQPTTFNNMDHGKVYKWSTISMILIVSAYFSVKILLKGDNTCFLKTLFERTVSCGCTGAYVSDWACGRWSEVVGWKLPLVSRRSMVGSRWSELRSQSGFVGRWPVVGNECWRPVVGDRMSVVSDRWLQV